MDTAALKVIWGEVVDAGDDVPLYFLFAPALEEPELRSTFSILMLAQHDKLVAAPVPCGLETSPSSTTLCPYSATGP
jgi:hypothetical protein